MKNTYLGKTAKTIYGGFGLAVKLALPAALLLVVGGWAGIRRGEGADGALREKLLSRAFVIARAVPSDLAESLEFGPADGGSEAFWGIRANLEAACAGVAGGHIYTLALRDDKVLLGPSACGTDGVVAGSEYSDTAGKARRALETGRPEVAGPVGGAAVLTAAAYVPIADDNGRTVMAVVLEVPAAAWAAETAAARESPLNPMLWLALLPALALVIFGLRGIGAAAPAALALVCGLMFFWAAGRGSAGRDYKLGAGRLTELAGKEWGRRSAEAAELLKFEAHDIETIPVLKRAWTARNLADLSGAAVPLKAALAGEFGIDCLNYIKPDGTMFFSADDPHAGGRLVFRATLRKAMAEGRDTWGLEPAPAGFYSLRYAHPLAENGKITGYLELGMTANSLAAKVGRTLQLDLSNFAKNGQYGGDGRELPRAVYARLHLLHQEAPLPPETETGPARGGWRAGANPGFSVRIGERTFSGGVVRVPAAAGGAADLVVMNDVTPAAAAAEGQAAIEACAAASFFFLALALLWPANKSGPVAAALRLRERILQSLAQGYLLVDRSGRVAEANAAYCRMSGYSAKELKGMNIADLEESKTSEGAAAGNGAESSRHRRKDGSGFEVVASIRWINENGGCLAVFIEDLSSRRTAAAAGGRTKAGAEFPLFAGITLVEQDVNSVEAPPKAAAPAESGQVLVSSGVSSGQAAQGGPRRSIIGSF